MGTYVESGTTATSRQLWFTSRKLSRKSKIYHQPHPSVHREYEEERTKDQYIPTILIHQYILPFQIPMTYPTPM